MGQIMGQIMDHNMDKYCSKLHKVWEQEVYAHRSEVSSFKHGQEE